MSKAVPWSIKGVDFDAREAAKEAARRDGVTLGDWMNRAIAERAAEIGSNVQDFDADERLEAVAAQLARLSRQSEDEGERGPRKTSERDGDRPPVWVEEENQAPAPVPERGARRRPTRAPVAALPPEAPARPLRDSFDAEALLEKAVAAFEARAGRVEARTARALSDVAERIESAESERADMLAQVDSRLADLETHLRKKARSSDVEPLRGALDRLESRIEDLASREPEPRDDETLRKLDRKLSHILARVERAETAPAAERDEHFARLEKRFDALLARLDRPAPLDRSPTSRAAPPPPQRRGDLQGAIAEISARQRALDSAPPLRPQPEAAASAHPAPVARPPVASEPPAFAAPPPAFDARFDALARKLELLAERNAAPRDDRRIDALQSGIDALSSRIEDMRRDFSSLKGAARDTAAPNVEKALRDLTHRIEVLAAAQPSVASKDVAGLRGDLAGLTRTLGELAPRGAVAGLESAMRDLTNRVETTRSVVQRVAETQIQSQNLAEPNADVQALSRQLAEISRGLHDVAPRGAVAGVESAMRELANRVDSAREIMARVGERSADTTVDFEPLNRQLAEIARTLGDVAPRGDVAELQHAVRDLSKRVDSTREIVARASERPPLDSSRDFEALNRQLAEIGRSLNDVAPHGAVSGLEHAVRDLSDRFDLTRELMARASERPVDSSKDFEALNRQLAEIGRSLNDVAPRGAVSGLEHAVRDLSDRVDSTREIVARVSERPLLDSSRDFEVLNRHLAEIGRSLGDVAPRGAVVGLEHAVRDLSDRVDSARSFMESATPAHGAVGVAEIEALGQQVAAMGQALSDVAPRSQIAALDLAVRDLSERVERSRDEGLRDSVLAPIEHLAADVRRALAETGASADFDGVIRQMRALEDKIDDLRGAGGANRADFLRACDQSDQLRASIATALERMAPLETMEKQVASLTDRLEMLSGQSIEASRAHANGLAQTSANWREIGSRLDDLAVRIDRAADMRGEPAPSDEHRFDELSRRLDFMHQALAERIDGAVQARGQQAQQGLEPLLRALADKLENAMAPQADSRAIEALERQVAEVSERLERGASHSNIQLQQALGDLAARLDQQRDVAREAARETLLEALEHLPAAGRDEQAARDIADLREKHENSDRRAQQTLSAVHETLEKVVDRLAMLEEDVQEVRVDARSGYAEPPAPAEPAPPSQAAPRAAASQPWTNPAQVESSHKVESSRKVEPRAQPVAQDFDAASFLVEPGAGRPNSSPASDAEAEGDHHFDIEAPRVKLSRDDEAALLTKSQGSNYIDVARRALAARAAADAVEQEDGARRAAGGVAAAAERAKDGAAKFIRPLAVGEKRGGGARMGVLLAAGASVLAMGMFQLYRVATNPAAPPMQTIGPRAEIAAPAPVAPAPAHAPATADAGAPQGDAAAAPAPTAPNSAPVPGVTSSAAPGSGAKPGQGASLSTPPGANLSTTPPGASLSTPPGANLSTPLGASLVDPLAVGSINPRNNDMAAIQAGAQAATLKAQADKGDAAAQFELAARFAEGRGVDRNPVTAISWFEKAADQGQAQAEYRLGVIFEKGLGATRDAHKAQDYYQKAAAQGHVRAMHNLAVIEAEGVDGKPDYATAAQWFRRAADYGVRDSQYNLAILYARGMGVAQNMPLSYVWFAAAADQGDADAAKKRDEIAGRLSASELAAAKKQAAGFHPRTPSPAVNEPPALGARPQASATN